MNFVDKERRVLDNPDNPCPPELLCQMVTVRVNYKRLDGTVCDGCIEVNQVVADDVGVFFDEALHLDFPIQSVMAAGEAPYYWNDDKLMAANVSSGFNYRQIAGTNKVSLHGRGLAFDINPRLNPYVRYENGHEIVAPHGSAWRPGEPGVLSAGHALVRLMVSKGWEWGGNWTAESGRIDYQHFQKTSSF